MSARPDRQIGCGEGRTARQTQVGSGCLHLKQRK